MRHRLLAPALAGIVLVGGGSAAAAAPAPAADAATCTITWAGAADGGWTSASNWTPARVPSDDDVVCVPAGTTPRIRLTASASALRLVTAAATVQVAAGATLAVGSLTVVGGRIAGPGTVRVTPVSPSSARFYRATLSNRARVEVRSGRPRIDGRLAVSGGSSLVLMSAFATVTADVVDVDHDPANRLALDRSVLTAGDRDATPGTVRIDVPLDLDRSGITVDSAWTLATDHLVQLAADGTLGRADGHEVGITLQGRLILPRSVTAIDGAVQYVAFPSSPGLRDPAGGDAFTTLARVAGGAQLTVPPGVVLTQPLTVTGSRTFVYVPSGVTLQAPRMTVAGGSRLVNDGRLALLAGGRFVVDHAIATAGRVDGTVVGRGGRLDWADTVSSLVLDSASTVNQCTNLPLCPTFQVSGAASLAGTLHVRTDQPATVGTRTVVMRIGGRVTGTFDHVVSDTHPVAVTYEPDGGATDVVATITG